MVKLVAIDVNTITIETTPMVTITAPDKNNSIDKIYNKVTPFICWSSDFSYRKIIMIFANKFFLINFYKLPNYMQRYDNI